MVFNKKMYMTCYFSAWLLLFYVNFVFLCVLHDLTLLYVILGFTGILSSMIYGIPCYFRFKEYTCKRNLLSVYVVEVLVIYFKHNITLFYVVLGFSYINIYLFCAWFYITLCYTRYFDILLVCCKIGLFM